MKKIKSWIKYLAYFIIILLLVLVRQTKEIMSYTNDDLNTNYLNILISTILGICIGLILGLEYFINEKRKIGTWRINVSKIIIIGLPSLYIAFTNIFLFSSIPFLKLFVKYPFDFLSKYFTIGYVNLFQVILGYIIITCFFKYNKESS